MERLTDDFIKKEIARTIKLTYLRDKEVRGFFVRHNPDNGRTTFHVQADQKILGADGAQTGVRQVTVPLGHALLPKDDPRRLSCADARREASKVKSLILSGEDFTYGGKRYTALNQQRTREEQKKRVANYTLKQAMADYLEYRPPKSDYRKKEFEKLIKRHIGESMLKRPVTSITPEWIATNYRTTNQIHTAFMHLSGILRYVDDIKPGTELDREVRKTLRAQLARFKPKVRELTIRKHHLPVIWNELDNVEDPYGDLLRFLLLTMMRCSEAGALTWDRVDFKDESFWVEDTKSGSPLHLPMSSTVKELLERRYAARQAEMPNETWVFGTLRCGRGYPLAGDGSVDIAKYKTAVQKATEDPRVSPTPHQFRKFANNVLRGHLGIGPDIVRSIGNWAPPKDDVGSLNYYDRSDVAPKRLPMQRYDDWLMAAINDEDTNVVPINEASAA